MHPLGFIHGRFQVLHNDHLAYLLSGKERCEHLIIGITNPDEALTKTETTNPERSSAENNPLTYEERKLMIEAALPEAGVAKSAFTVTPFPICRPDMIALSAPREAVYYLTIYDDWGREKKARLEDLGLTTEVMWERSPDQKGISGTDVRDAIRDGGDWKAMVPPAVAELVEEMDLQERFRGLSPSGS